METKVTEREQPIMPMLAFNHGGGGGSACADFLRQYLDGLPEETRAHAKGVVVVEAHLRTSPIVIGGDADLAGHVAGLLANKGIEHHVESNFGAGEAQAHGLRDVKAALRACTGTVDNREEASPIPLPFAFVSIFDHEDAPSHLRLGQAIASLRHQGIIVLGSGLPSFHNFSYFFSRDASFKARGRKHSKVFDTWLRDTLAPGREEVERGHAARERRLHKLAQWDRAPSARHAHPEGEADHFMPLLVLAGAAGGGPATAVCEASHAKILGKRPGEDSFKMSHFQWR